MATGTASEIFDNSTPTKWLMDMPNFDPFMALFIDPLGPAFFPAPSELSFNLEPPPMETQLDARLTDDDDPGNLNAIPLPSSSVSPPVSSPPLLTFYPPKWYEIPQRRYKYGRKQWSYTPSESILFQVDGFPGLNMGDAFRNKFAGLQGRDDLVMQNAKTAFCCRFLFPGYPSKSPQIFTTYWNKERDPITRSKLAHHIARKLKHYLDSMRNSYVMDASTDQRWEIGEGFMLLDNMYLAKLESISIGSFQPQLWVVDPSV